MCPPPFVFTHTAGCFIFNLMPSFKIFLPKMMSQHSVTQGNGVMQYIHLFVGQPLPYIFF